MWLYINTFGSLICLQTFPESWNQTSTRGGQIYCLIGMQANTSWVFYRKRWSNKKKTFQLKKNLMSFPTLKELHKWFYDLYCFGKTFPAGSQGICFNTFTIALTLMLLLQNSQICAHVFLASYLLWQNCFCTSAEASTQEARGPVYGLVTYPECRFKHGVWTPSL